MANLATLSDGRADIFQEITQKAVCACLSDPSLNTFDVWARALVDAAHNSKQKGDAFERLCAEYLKRVAGFPEVWLLADLPQELRAQLRLRKADYGIDLVCRDAHGAFHAVQAKFRFPRGRAQTASLGWRDLSTFDALCARSGPYAKHWVMTSANSVRRIGARSAKDQTVAVQRWRSLDRGFWLDLAQMHGQRLGVAETTTSTPSVEMTSSDSPVRHLPTEKKSQSPLDAEAGSPPDAVALRAARLAHFCAPTKQ